ncbi:unnamed protein product [Penicillium bialowiezense]
MQFKLATILLASVASAQLTTSPSPASSSSVAVSSTASPSSSATPSVNPDDYDCVYRGWGCDWKASEYEYGNDYCGTTGFKAGQTLSDGNQIVAVSKDGSGDCASKAGSKCCKVLAGDACKRGEKYLECVTILT